MMIGTQGMGKFGLVKVRLFRPWSIDHFLAALPSTYVLCLPACVFLPSHLCRFAV